MATTYYSEDHEWIEVDGDIATIGITEHAAVQLGDIVFVELKEEGDEFAKGDDIGVIESVKAASEIYAPVDCEVVEANEELEGNPAMINESPESGAWIYKVKLSDPSQLDDLMDADAYKALIG
ncbi:glycine cleavage system protein GcvH [Aestuariibius sp. HNIBRBA575]|uniref:glycine cleavage system protein GcvH n=1 Tax=Aestuariibius sp. HNIBRBA575 TaxID=3233343 RepID=UPI0034A0E0F5